MNEKVNMHIKFSGFMAFDMNKDNCFLEIRTSQKGRVIALPSQSIFLGREFWTESTATNRTELFSLLFPSSSIWKLFTVEVGAGDAFVHFHFLDWFHLILCLPSTQLLFFRVYEPVICLNLTI